MRGPEKGNANLGKDRVIQLKRVGLSCKPAVNQPPNLATEEAQKLVTQPSGKHGGCGLLAVVLLDDLHRGAHVTGDFEHARAVT